MTYRVVIAYISKVFINKFFNIHNLNNEFNIGYKTNENFYTIHKKIVRAVSIVGHKFHNIQINIKKKTCIISLLFEKYIRNHRTHNSSVCKGKVTAFQALFNMTVQALRAAVTDIRLKIFNQRRLLELSQ